VSLPVFSLDEIYNGISHESVAVFPFYCIQERGHVIPAVGYIVYRGDGIDTIVVDRSAVDGRFDGFFVGNSHVYIFAHGLSVPGSYDIE